VLRVVSGDATPEEIAAILAIVSARAAGSADTVDVDPPADAWSRGYAHRGTRARPPSGSDADPPSSRWRTSFWPR
jgi:hypothetical protein